MILENILKQYKNNYNLDYINEKYYLDSPGNILKYLFILSENNINLLENKLECIFFLIDEYKKNGVVLIRKVFDSSELQILKKKITNFIIQYKKNMEI